jgi:hypothetical protein
MHHGALSSSFLDAMCTMIPTIRKQMSAWRDASPLDVQKSGRAAD